MDAQTLPESLNDVTPEQKVQIGREAILETFALGVSIAMEIGLLSKEPTLEDMYAFFEGEAEHIHNKYQTYLAEQNVHPIVAPATPEPRDGVIALPDLSSANQTQRA